MKGLTEKQNEVYSYILSHLENTSRLPSLSDIASSFSCDRRNAYEFVSALEKKGFLKRDANGKIMLSDEERDRMINKRIEKGDGTVCYASIPGSKDGYFSLSIFSDEMKNIGLLPGDEGIFRKTDKAESGKIVICSIADDGSKLLRRIVIRPDGLAELVPENDILGKIVTNNVKIEAVLVEVRRKISE